jgi:hypothetical protein
VAEGGVDADANLGAFNVILEVGQTNVNLLPDMDLMVFCNRDSDSVCLQAVSIRVSSHVNGCSARAGISGV